MAASWSSQKSADERQSLLEATDEPQSVLEAQKNLQSPSTSTNNSQHLQQHQDGQHDPVVSKLNRRTRSNRYAVTIISVFGLCVILQSQYLFH